MATPANTIQGGDTQTRYTDILKAEYIDSLFPYKKQTHGRRKIQQ